MTPNEMISKICDEFGMSIAEVKGEGRTRPLPQIRAVIYANLYYHYPELSLAAIGKMFNRGHATVIHGIKCANNPHDVATQRVRERVNQVVSPPAKLKWTVSNECTNIPLANLDASKNAVNCEG